MTTESTVINAAMKALIHDDDAQELATQLLGVQQLVRAGTPVRLTGRPSIMNVLLDLSVADEDAFFRLLEDVDSERESLGQPPLSNRASGRTRYMREFMAERRDRSRRLREAWNSALPDSERLRGAARLDFERDHHNRWGREKARREDTLRREQGRRLTVHEQRAVADQLWRDVDNEIRGFEAFARSISTERDAARRLHAYVFTLGKEPT